VAILANKFFESYDLLPPDYKAMLYASNHCPLMEDLEAAWKLVEAEGSFSKLFRDHARKYDPDEWKAIKAREKAEYDRKVAAEREKAARDRWNRKLQREGRFVTTYHVVPEPKNARLIERVKAEVALDMVTKKQAKLVNAPGTLVARTEWVPYKSRAERERELRERENAKYGEDIYAAPDKNKPPMAGTNKRLGNSY